MESINEGSSAILTIAFTDQDGDAITPDSATFTIYDKFSGTERRSGTISSLASSITFVTTDEDNAILNQNNRYEVVAILIEFSYNSRYGKGEYFYKVNNLAQVT